MCLAVSTCAIHNPVSGCFRCPQHQGLNSPAPSGAWPSLANTEPAAIIRVYATLSTRHPRLKRLSATGLALVNAGDTPVDLLLVLRNASGVGVFSRTLSNVAVRGHIARFTRQLFPELTVDSFEGTLSVVIQTPGGRIATVPVTTGAMLTSKIVFEGATPQSPAPAVTSLRLGLRLDPSVAPGPAPANPAADGSFRIQPVPLGNYRFAITPPLTNAYVKSIRLGDTDVLNSGLRLESLGRHLNSPS